ncbi:MAG: ion channel [Bacteroidota bacterium]
MPFLVISNICAGIILVSKKKFTFNLLVIFLISTTLLVFLDLLNFKSNSVIGHFMFIGFFLFYGIVTVEIIGQIWKTKEVGKNVILGLISGFIALGLLGSFLFVTIEKFTPNSFSGLNNLEDSTYLFEQLNYFSFISLMTIGYGDIVPKAALAKKATIFIGLAGQFYLVLLTAIVVGKYINQSKD